MRLKCLRSTVAIIFVFCIMMAVNVFAQPTVEATSYSLKSETEDYLLHISDKVTVFVLMAEEDFVNLTDDSGSSSYYNQVDKLLKEMSAYENFTLEYKKISAASASELSSKYPDIEWLSTENFILVECGDKYRMLTLSDVFTYNEEYLYYYGMRIISEQHIEESIMTAIERVTNTNVFQVTVSTGNGELLSEESEEYSNISQLLYNNGYEIESINLLTEEISDEIDALIMFAPSVDITDEQSEKINNWLLNGGEYGKTFMYVPFDYIESTWTIHDNLCI